MLTEGLATISHFPSERNNTVMIIACVSFIQNWPIAYSFIAFSHIANPISTLKVKDLTWNWSMAFRGSVQLVRVSFRSSPLEIPSSGNPANMSKRCFYLHSRNLTLNLKETEILEYRYCWLTLELHCSLLYVFARTLPNCATSSTDSCFRRIVKGSASETFLPPPAIKNN